MKQVVIYGSGGFAREIAMLIENINERKTKWDMLGFLDDNIEKHGKVINGYKILGGSNWLENKKMNVVLGIGSPNAKEKIVQSLKRYDKLEFPNIIHPDVHIHTTNRLGRGIVICEGNILTCNITLEDFVTLNLNSTIGHDTIIKSYSTILPNSSISGNVRFEKGVDFGTNATIIQGKKVGEGTVVGAGATVVIDLPSFCTAVGAPAKPIKFHKGDK